eukprot:Phypoly_transcript_09143.p1 GENE.Phypoly_transcript_09143~~Phypoly_transcript_09143.p1  ORF type:complete len:403 (+),score=70.33 Phypoly_transcript_09143:95-1303(+)
MVLSNAAKITETLDSYTSKPNGIPGVVFRAVQKDGTVLYDGASGVRGVAHKDQPMTTDTIFWIASFTKLLTTISALQLVEQGKIALDDPAEKYAPELGKLQILTGFDAEDKPILQEPKTKITIRHLLTHTSGLTYDMYNANTKKYQDINKIPTINPLDRRALHCPLGFEPGTDWQYSVSLDWVGIIVENVTGQSLGAYMEKHIFEPLGIKSTAFSLSDEQVARHSHVHLRLPEKNLTEIDSSMVYVPKVDNHNGGGGSHSTASDYAAVLRAILNEGEGPTGPNGPRILKKETVDLLFADQTTAAGITIKQLNTNVPIATNDVPFPPGPKYFAFGGLVFGFDLPTGRPAGSLFWTGLPNCFWWVDRTNGVAGVILTQIVPYFDEEMVKCFTEVEQLVYAGLKK